MRRRGERRLPTRSIQHLQRSKSLGRHKGGSQPDAQFDFGLGALNLIRDVPDGVECPPQMANCLCVGTAAQSLGGGALVIRDRTHKLVAALEMPGFDS
jgi:hypothetical protein